MTATFTEWTTADSRAVDAWARSHTRSPLKLDPHLRELLAEHCTTCDEPMRPSNRTAAEFPDTVPKGGREICQKCYLESRAKPDTL